MRSAKTVILSILTLLPLMVGSVQGATPTDAVIASIQFPDGDIVGLAAGPRGEVAVYDRQPRETSSLMRFLLANERPDRTIEVVKAPETVFMKGDAPEFKGWLQWDGSILYALSRYKKSTDWGISSWQQMWLHVINGRKRLQAINYNSPDRVPGNDSITAPEDFWYSVNGFAIKPFWAEDANNPLIVIDDTLKGNLEILQMDATGMQLQQHIRHSYRERYAGCDWPDVDPDKTWYDCRWNHAFGNAVALEWTFDTRDTLYRPLADRDELYLVDPFHSLVRVRRFRFPHDLTNFWLMELPELDPSTYDPMLGNGVHALYTEPRLDQLWIASGVQSFQTGYVARIDTYRETGQVLNPVLGDERILMKDRSTVGRWWIPVTDGFTESGPLILREVRNGVVVNSVTALTDYGDGELQAATFDPRYGLAYLALGDTVYVVSVDTPDGTDLDGDGLPNDYETAHGLDPENPDDARQDADRDGWNYLDEFHAGTDPTNPDSDGDGVSDKTDPVPLDQAPCASFILDGVLSQLDIAGLFRCTLSGALVIGDGLTVLPGGELDIDAWSIRMQPGARARAGSRMRLR